MFNKTKLRKAEEMFKENNKDFETASYTMYLEERKNEIYNPENFEKQTEQQDYIVCGPNSANHYSHDKVVRGKIQEEYHKGVKVINITLNTRGKERFTEQVYEGIRTNTLIALIVKYASEFGITVNFYIPEIDKTIKYVPSNSVYAKREKIYNESIITNIIQDHEYNEIKGKIGIVNSLDELFSSDLQEKIEDFVKKSKKHLFFYLHFNEEDYKELQERLEEFGISFHTFFCLINLYFINACIKHGVLFSLFYMGKDNCFNQVSILDCLGVEIDDNEGIQSADAYPNFV